MRERPWPVVVHRPGLYSSVVLERRTASDLFVFPLTKKHTSLYDLVVIETPYPALVRPKKDQDSRHNSLETQNEPTQTILKMTGRANRQQQQ